MVAALAIVSVRRGGRDAVVCRVARVLSGSDDAAGLLVRNAATPLFVLIVGAHLLLRAEREGAAARRLVGRAPGRRAVARRVRRFLVVRSRLLPLQRSRLHRRRRRVSGVGLPLGGDPAVRRRGLRGLRQIAKALASGGAGGACSGGMKKLLCVTMASCPTVSRANAVRTCCSTPTTRLTGTPGATRRSRAPATEEKPIFLSIGYSTCHWCHVMEHESFEDTAVAEALNRDFVSIKVDREERPDVDRVYMTFVQATTGAGGWPMSVFLTPDLKPFFGGTYFPPASRWGRPGFKDVLAEIARAWHDGAAALARVGRRRSSNGCARRPAATSRRPTGRLSPGPPRSRPVSPRSRRATMRVTAVLAARRNFRDRPSCCSCSMRTA